MRDKLFPKLPYYPKPSKPPNILDYTSGDSEFGEEEFEVVLGGEAGVHQVTFY